MKRLSRLVSFIIIGSLVIFSGCEQDNSTSPTPDRDKLFGVWDCSSDGNGGPRNFSLTISASNSAEDQIKMENFDGGTGIVFANVSGNSISIPSQQVGFETVSGNGTYHGSTITFSYSLDDGQGVEHRNATASNKH